jgi:hypothetical protein
MLSPRRSTSATSTTLHAPAAVTIATNADDLPKEKHKCDEHHCMLQQQSLSLPTRMLSPRRSTSATSTTACSSSSHHLHYKTYLDQITWAAAGHKRGRRPVSSAFTPTAKQKELRAMPMKSGQNYRLKK